MKLTIESEWVDWRKHGRPFVRRVASNSFVEPTHTEWAKKTMKQYFAFNAEAGELLQVRFSDGSWKNDSKHYVRVVAPDPARLNGYREAGAAHLIEVPQAEAGREIAAAKVGA